MVNVLIRRRRMGIDPIQIGRLKNVTAEEFCEHWFGLHLLSEEERAVQKNERGYRAKCLRLLARVLGKPENTVDSWGKRFERMPQDLQVALRYANALRLHLMNTPDALLSLFVEHDLLSDSPDKQAND